jgi:hypothetical protein
MIPVVFFLRFESDVLLERFRSTADFIKNLQDHAGSPLNIKEHLSRKNDMLAVIFGVSLFVQLTN